jgi:CRISPR-associated protein Cas4
MGSQQEDAKKSHQILSDLERRRKSIMKSDLPFDFKTKEFDVPLQSNRLGIHGRLDMVIETSDSELIPVEFKVMKSNRGRVRMDHKYQLSTLALLIEETENTVVKRGIIHYMLEPTSILIHFTEGVKRRTFFYVNQIKNMLREGTIPQPRSECSKNRVGCGFADFCSDF